MTYNPHQINMAHISRILRADKISKNPYKSRLSAVTGNIDMQIADRVVYLFDLWGNITGEFLLVFDDFINKVL